MILGVIGRFGSQRTRVNRCAYVSSRLALGKAELMLPVEMGRVLTWRRRLRFTQAALAVVIVAVTVASVFAVRLVVATLSPHRKCLASAQANAHGTQLNIGLDYEPATDGLVRLDGIEASYAFRSGHDIPQLIFVLRNAQSGRVDGQLTKRVDRDGVISFNTGWFAPRNRHGSLTFDGGELATVTLRVRSYDRLTPTTITIAEVALAMN